MFSLRFKNFTYIHTYIHTYSSKIHSQKKFRNRHIHSQVCNGVRLAPISAFTLAEVLITIGIIGIVAALTIPNVLQSQREKQTVVKLKKAYSTLSNAYSLAVQENGTPDNWELTDMVVQGPINLINKLAPYLNLSKNCGSDPSCIPADYKLLTGDTMTQYTDTNYTKGQLADGTLLVFIVKSPTCTLNRGTSLPNQNICAMVSVDITGFDKPNKCGVDMFSFYITKYGIIPQGDANNTLSYNFYNSCIGANPQGWGCTAWVLYNENLDYLDCTDLNWDTKTSCN